MANKVQRKAIHVRPISSPIRGRDRGLRGFRVVLTEARSRGPGRSSASRIIIPFPGLVAKEMAHVLALARTAGIVRLAWVPIRILAAAPFRVDPLPGPIVGGLEVPDPRPGILATGADGHQLAVCCCRAHTSNGCVPFGAHAHASLVGGGNRDAEQTQPGRSTQRPFRARATCSHRSLSSICVITAGPVACAESAGLAASVGTHRSATSVLGLTPILTSLREDAPAQASEQYIELHC